MNVLTVFAHPGSRSFCHAVLDRFSTGLQDAGHANEIVDLYAIGFDPILRERDTPSWLTETIPDEMLERMRLRENLLSGAGGPLKRYALRRLIGDRDARGPHKRFVVGACGTCCVWATARRPSCRRCWTPRTRRPSGS